MLKGHYDVTLQRHGEKVVMFGCDNFITDELIGGWLSKIHFGRRDTLHSGALLLVDSTSFSAISAADTYTGINNTNGWVEFTGYSDLSNNPNRRANPLFQVPPALSLTSDPGSAPKGATFNITSSATLQGVGTVMGVFAETITQGDNSNSRGTLISLSEFPAPLTVASGDVLFIKYTLTVF